MTPAAGESVTEGTVLEWHVKVGDPIKVDDTIVEISTDKVDVELPSPASGTVMEILVAEGDTVTVGQVIARLPASDGASSATARGGDGTGPARMTRTVRCGCDSRPQRSRRRRDGQGDPDGAKSRRWRRVRRRLRAWI